jgi:hypothetical protein
MSIPILAACKKGFRLTSGNISEILHDYSFSTIISDMFFDSHRVHLRFSAGFSAKAWLFAYPIIPCFCLC